MDVEVSRFFFLLTSSRAIGECEPHPDNKMVIFFLDSENVRVCVKPLCASHIIRVDEVLCQRRLCDMGKTKAEGDAIPRVSVAVPR